MAIFPFKRGAKVTLLGQEFVILQRDPKMQMLVLMDCKQALKTDALDKVGLRPGDKR